MTGEPTGLEVACRYKKHGKCRRDASFLVCGGRENATRWLKYWCIAAALVDDPEEHIHMELPSIEDLASMEELDTMAFFDAPPSVSPVKRVRAKRKRARPVPSPSR